MSFLEKVEKLREYLFNEEKQLSQIKDMKYWKKGDYERVYLRHKLFTRSVFKPNKNNYYDAKLDRPSRAIINILTDAEIKEIQDFIQKERANDTNTNGNMERNSENGLNGRNEKDISTGRPSDATMDRMGIRNDDKGRSLRESDRGLPNGVPNDSGETSDRGLQGNTITAKEGGARNGTTNVREPNGYSNNNEGGVSPSGRGSNRASRPTTTRERKISSNLGETKLKELSKKAEGEAVELYDLDNIRATLPVLKEEQQEDVYKAENRLKENQGMLFTNGTGTGKTYTGLGIIKRFVKQGKTNILILVPTDVKAKDWIKDGANLLIDIVALTSVRDAGKGVNITTYANFRDNHTILTRDFDLIVYDESHKIMEEKDGAITTTTTAHFLNTRHSAYTEQALVKQIFFSNPENEEKYYTHQREMRKAKKELSELAINYSPIPHYDELTEKEKEKAKKKLGEQFKKEFDVFLRGILNERKSQFGYFWQIDKVVERAKKLNELNYEINEINKNVRHAIHIEDIFKRRKTVKVIFLSATPFKSEKSLAYADETLHDIGVDNAESYDNFFIENFAYRKRQGKLTKPDLDRDTIDKLEINYNEKLKTDGALSGRKLDVDVDYERKFFVLDTPIVRELNRAVEWLDLKENAPLKNYFQHVVFSFPLGQQLQETIKIQAISERIDAHLVLGRKVVIFHSYQTNDDLPKNPLLLTEESQYSFMSDKKKVTRRLGDDFGAMQKLKEFNDKFPDLIKLEKGESIPAEVEKAFGDKVVFFNGKTSKTVRAKNVERFNNDDSIRILVVNEKAGKEGISLHDTDGKFQRVLINVSLPYDSISAIQVEGRVYRLGGVSNAIIEYPKLNVKGEGATFGEKINNRVGTTENLAMGSDARALARTFKEGYMSATDAPPSEEDGQGGKEFDKRAVSDDPFKDAIFAYKVKQKKRRTDLGKDYFPTPEPIGMLLVQYADVRRGDRMLEPSGGDGSIGRYFPPIAKRTYIEPSEKLRDVLALNIEGGEVKGGTFEEHNTINKYNTIVMNPPYGKQSKMAKDHTLKALEHLRSGGRVVSLVPAGGSITSLFSDIKLAGEIEDEFQVIAIIKLPSVAFKGAGTAVSTQIIVIDKVVLEREEYEEERVTSKEIRKRDKDGNYVLDEDGNRTSEIIEEKRTVYLSRKVASTKSTTIKKDLTRIEDIEELFEKMKNITIPKRNF